MSKLPRRVKESDEDVLTLMRFGLWGGARRRYPLDAALLAANLVRPTAAAALRVVLAGDGEQHQRRLPRLRAHQLRFACARVIHIILVYSSRVACMRISYVSGYVRAYEQHGLNSISKCRLTLQ